MKTTTNVIAAAAMISLCGTAALADSSASSDAPASVLFVQHANKVTFDGDRLTLEGPDQNVIAFTERPHRAAATIALDKFVKSWSEGQDSFADDPPNAALVGETQNGDPVSLIVEITNPDLGDGTISYGYTVLKGEVPESITNPYFVIDDSVNPSVPETDLAESTVNLGSTLATVTGFGGINSDFEAIKW